MTPFQRLILATAAISAEPIAIARPPAPRPGPVFPPKCMLLPRDVVLDLGMSPSELAELDAEAAMTELGPDVALASRPAEPPRVKPARPYRPNRAAQRAAKQRLGRFA